MNLVFIHGRAQQGKSPAAIQAEWEEAWGLGLIAAGLQRPIDINITLPFYGDRLDDLIRRIEAPLLIDVITRGGALDDGLQVEAALLLEMTGSANISSEDIQHELEPGVPTERGVENSAWVRIAARLLDQTILGFAAISRITHDVAVYLANPGVRMQVDKIVSDLLGEGPCVVVAHSLGSIVAYNVLSRCKLPIQVMRLVTVGSPLGYEAVREKIEWPIAMPRCTASWFNARDPRDIVAGYPLDKSRFPVQPAIENRSVIDNDTENRHGISGYLKDPEVARRIWEGLTAPAMALR